MLALKKTIHKCLKNLYNFMAKQRFRRLGYGTFFENRPESAFAPDWSDLWFLYKAVRRRKPEMILEFGRGCSTVILAQALLDNRKDECLERGEMISIDASEYWAEITRQSMPGGLRDICRYII